MHRFSLTSVVIAVTCVVVATAAVSAQNIPGVPSRIIQTEGQPALALFNNPNESYALSREFASLWQPVRPIETIPDPEYGAYLHDYPIRADLAPQRAIVGYQAPNEPGCLVVTWRDKRRSRHYINSPTFLRAVGITDLVSITTSDLHGLAPMRGRDFRVAPPPSGSMVHRASPKVLTGRALRRPPRRIGPVTPLSLIRRALLTPGRLGDGTLPRRQGPYPPEGHTYQIKDPSVEPNWRDPEKGGADGGNYSPVSAGDATGGPR
jgi:hypothetical protein